MWAAAEHAQRGSSEAEFPAQPSISNVALYSYVGGRSDDAVARVGSPGLGCQRGPPGVAAGAGLVPAGAMGRPSLGTGRPPGGDPVLADHIAVPRLRAAGNGHDRPAAAAVPPPRHPS